MRFWTLCAPMLARALPVTARQQDNSAAHAGWQAMLDALGIEKSVLAQRVSARRPQCGQL